MWPWHSNRDSAPDAAHSENAALNDQIGSSLFADMQRVANFLGFTLLAILAPLTLYGIRTEGETLPGLLAWAGTFLMVGTFAGFLFGIPKVLQGGRPNEGVKPPIDAARPAADASGIPTLKPMAVHQIRP
jgi:hypothetical protein